MAKPGDPFRDVYTADWYNRVSSVIDPKYGGPRPQSSNNQYVTVYNHSTTPREIWEAVSLGTPKLDYEVPLTDGAHGEFAFNTKDLDGDDPDNLVILQEPLAGEVGASARALMSGVSWLKLTTDSTETNIAINSSDEVDYAGTGRIEVIRAFEYDTDLWIAIVVIANKPGGSIVCITDGSGIAARSGTTISSATCTIVNRSGSTISTGSSTVTVYNLSTTAVGNSVYIVAEPTNIGYVAVWEDC